MTSCPTASEALGPAIAFLASERNRTSAAGEVNAARLLSAAIQTLEEGNKAADSPRSVVERPERKQCNLIGRVAPKKGTIICKVFDLSLNELGAMVEVIDFFGVGDDVTIALDDIGSLHGTVRWVIDSRFGIELKPSLQDEEKLKVLFDSLR